MRRGSLSEKHPAWSREAEEDSDGEGQVARAASVASAQHLMCLQRQQLAESEVLDQPARRMLHDEVLPCPGHAEEIIRHVCYAVYTVVS